MIPTSSLAAILVDTGFKRVNFTVIRELKDYGWSEVVIYAVTVATIVIEDFLTGVVAWIVLSAIKSLYVFSHLAYERRGGSSTNGRGMRAGRKRQSFGARAVSPRHRYSPRLRRSSSAISSLMEPSSRLSATRVAVGVWTMIRSFTPIVATR